MFWQASYDHRGTWHWTSAEMANGWAAQVVDDSQSYTPARPTSYHAQALGVMAITELPNLFDSLEDAKVAALELAMSLAPERGVTWKA